MMMKPAPLIKEHRLDKLVAALECVGTHAYDRARQIDCILTLYPGKSEKSVVRGMVIPSSRHLGFIIGHGDFIRLSANGKIMVESRALYRELHDRVSRAVLYEIDKRAFGFVDVLLGQSGIPAETFFGRVRSALGAPSAKQADERTRHWLAMLIHVHLVYRDEDDTLRAGQSEYEQTLQDLDATSKDVEAFRDSLFAAYAELTSGTAGVADIPDLRKRVATAMLRSDDRLILTEAQFDQLLTEVPFSSSEYLISLGRPMGAEEQLFRYHGGYFRTLSIRFLERREVDR